MNPYAVAEAWGQESWADYTGVSLVSPNYGRLWLSAAHHPGDTVSSSQAEALVLAAEARTGLRPRWRTELLQ